MDDTAATLVGFFMLTMGLIFNAILTNVMVKGIRSGNLKRNDALGIRTKATTASDQAWEMGHQAAVPLLKVSTAVGVFTATFAVVFLLIFLMMGSGVPLLVYGIAGVGFALQMGLLIGASVKANTAARNV